MIYLSDDRLEPAYAASDRVVNSLHYKDMEGIIRTTRLIEIVKSILNCNIEVSACDFADVDRSIKNCGAMMRYVNDNNTFDIVLNTHCDLYFRRLSLVHQLGCLFFNKDVLCNAESDDYLVSSHVSWHITDISKTDYQSNDNLLKEQLANIFALRVLMPYVRFYDALIRYDSITMVADRFGVKSDGVLSRIMLID